MEDNYIHYGDCPNCGHIVAEGTKYCPECGFPLRDTGRSSTGKQKEKKKKSPVGRIIFWVVVIGLVIWGKLEYDAQNYGVNLHNVMYYAGTSAEHLDNAGVIFINVWNNSVNKVIDPETDKYTREADGTGQFYSDFNDALGVLVKDNAYRDEISQASEARDEAYSLMGQLTNPPKRYEEAYRDIKNYYTCFSEFYNVATNPNGTLKDYREQYEKARDAYNKSFYPVSMY